MFRFSQFSLEIPFTHLTLPCHKRLFHMDNHIIQVGSVMVVAIIFDELVHPKTLTKKAPGFFFIPDPRF